MRQRKLLLPPFHGEARAALHGDDRRGGRPRDRQLAGRHAVRAGAAHAGDHARRDHGRHLRHRGHAGPGHAGVRPAAARSGARSTSPRRPEAQLSSCSTSAATSRRARRALFLEPARPPHLRGRSRRAAPATAQRTDILSLLLEAETEDGERLTDQELRDELLTLVLAGHETTANSLAWAFERLLRHPAAYERLRDVARSGDEPDGYLEATIHEAMRSRPVIPIIGRRVTVPWQLGEYRDARRQLDPDEHPAAAPPRRRLPGPVRVPARALRRRASPAPTPGSRSAAASAAASAPPWPWPSSAWCSARSPGAPTSRRPTRGPSTPATATSTMIPAGGARVVMTARRAA